MAAKERSEFHGGRRQPDQVGLGVEWSGLVVSDVEQEGEQDWCVENVLGLGWVKDEIGFRWIGLGW